MRVRLDVDECVGTRRLCLDGGDVAHDGEVILRDHICRCNVVVSALMVMVIVEALLLISTRLV